MDDFEREKILASAYALRDRELIPPSWEDPFSDMCTDEKSKLLIEFMHQNNTLKEVVELLKSERSSSLDYKSKFEEEHRLNLSLQSKMDTFLSTIESLREQLSLMNRHKYGSKSQKRKLVKPVPPSEDHSRDKDDFDGTAGSLGSSVSSASGTGPSGESRVDMGDAVREKELRLYRQGLSYRTMSADSQVFHKSDAGRLPYGAVLIKRLRRYSYEQVSRIVEHDYEVLRYKTSDGLLHEGYFPAAGSPEIVDVVPGTHASGSLLAYLAFNKYVLDTPLYREMYRLCGERMYLSRMTLTNWLEKGSLHFQELVRELKGRCLEKDSIINCDETWCRVKVHGCYKKKYIWCLVNRLSKAVIYCYEDGSRGRDALKHILQDSQVKSLQSDGYNVYMYLDDNPVNVEHLCCMAHARAKFQYAFEQGGDADAAFILECIGELYKQEAGYERGKLSAEQIKICRNSLSTQEIIIRLRSKLDALQSDDHPPRGELMEKALRYMDTFWTQLFAYRHDGSYSIDNSIAERFIRPLAGERKNSLFFGSDKMARVSAVYHTIISTCKMQGVPVLEYLKRFFGEIVKGRRDYGNLLPLTIGISNNKY